MKILVVGAGAVASVLTKLLARRPAVEEVRCGARDLRRARLFIAGHKKIRLVRVEANNPRSIVAAGRGARLIINASLPDFNLAVMRAALKIGSHYQDLDAALQDDVHPEQLRLDRQFRRAGLMGLINAGVSPGITNLLARQTAEKLDRVDHIGIRVMEEQIASELIFTWSPVVALRELTSPPLVYRHGRYTSTKPFADAQQCNFPAPFGRRLAVSIYGDEVATIPRYISSRDVDYKASGTDVDFSKALYRLGLFNRRPVTVHGRSVVPVELFAKLAPRVPDPKTMIRLIRSGIVEQGTFLSVVETEGRVGRRHIRINAVARYPDLKKISRLFPGATYISYPTGVAAAAFALLHGRPGLMRQGVYPPEALDSSARKAVLLDLEQYGVTVSQEYSRGK
ncbi:MAG: saccharopine dehydrogenase NADP-binding domain-containing protein [Candidatus Kerfeldbacteria bacterium]|nr:saccharopine dehydrogenase NADP-binding domain-containing protein [Candidatus Kerfeldbacteria bacterium]